MQFKVPQDVQQADRIVSFLTLPQLIICVVGFGFAYAVYSILYKQGAPTVLWLIPVSIIGLLTIAFAFVKIANMPFHRFLAVILERFMTPSKRAWVKGIDRVIIDESYIPPEELKIKEEQKKATEIQSEKEKELHGIGQLTSVLDEQVEKNPMLSEIDNTKDKDLLQKAFLDEELRENKVESQSAGQTGNIPVIKKKRKRKADVKQDAKQMPQSEAISSLQKEEIKESEATKTIVANEEPPPPIIAEEPPPPAVIPEQKLELESKPEPESKASQTLSAEDLRKGTIITFNQ